ncbi:uncharacterized protein BJX67DRAFT_226150 [Aspergillus lucknowensis]|uniref:Cytochrome b5 heme-binding domain-containing protein n=1 Tax=Aspergillus lucknowensis TaxID=176173 RepID=A0ABR4LJ76_9EURO
MGWVGVAIVVATTCFLLYRHPPASWFPEAPPADQARTQSNLDEKAAPRPTEDKETPSSAITGSRPSGVEDEPAEETQTTPKASALRSPILDVPSFQLDDHKPDDGTGQNLHPDTRPIIDRFETQPPSLVPTNTMTALKPRSTSQPSTANDAFLMPPPPPLSRPRPPEPQRQPQPQPRNTLAVPAGRYPPRPGGSPGSSNLVSTPPSAAASQRGPPGSRPSSNSLSPTALTLKPTKKASQRAVLGPGYSPLDWAALTSNPNSKLRGENLPSTLIKVTPSMLKAHNGRKGMDAWTSYQGKVYNITPYLPFHPGGKGELLRGAGKDSAQLFLEIHPWVNWDAILGECLVGVLVSENEAISANQLDDMD